MTDSFHPLVQKWFQQKYGKATPIQSMSWKSISLGNHVLLSAPTGSGKTLASFLWAIDQLISGKMERRGISILYISPLKALNNDIQRNLEEPLREIQALFMEENQDFTPIRTAVRSGDTSQTERRRMLKDPPDILITTPESLNILLTSSSGRAFLDGIQTMIVDEIHGILESRRGVLLTTAMERLVHSNGEFQRIGLSATVHPMERAAAFLGGYQPQGEDGWISRRVDILQDKGAKSYSIQVISPPPEETDQEERWSRIARLCLDIIKSNKSTLFFTDSRRVTEKAARLINDLAEETLAWAHHGALSRELRYQVESRMKEGQLRAIVSTSSLELGIDIGHLDQVVLLQSPFTLGSALQRIGRAGHQVGETSRASLVPLHSGELLQSAALLEAMDRGIIEETHPLQNTLDVLAQIILSITQGQSWQEEDLFRLLRGSWTFHNLPRQHFDLVLEMLAGRYSGSNLQELQPRIIRDKLDGSCKAREKGAWLIYSSGGVIPDRGYYDLRVADSMVKIGELDEEFVWERNLGESFTLGNQVWKIMKITQSHVEVIPAQGMVHLVPFWKAEDMGRSLPLSMAMGEILDQAQEQQLSPGLLAQWQQRYHFDEAAAEELRDYLAMQMEQTEAPLPGRRHILFEHCKDNAGGEETEQLIIHTLRGGAVNQALALAMVQAWQKAKGVELSYFANNDGITLLTAGPMDPQELLNLLYEEDLVELLKAKLEGTAFFGARFRECAGRALLLPRTKNRGRIPLWLTRLRAKKLLSSVQALEDFPVLIETWRSCLEDHFDLQAAQALLDDLKSGETQWTLCHTTKASPMASSLVWRQVNLHMYLDDSPQAEGSRNWSDQLLQDLLRSSELRPLLDHGMIRHWQDRLQRLTPGYGAESSEEIRLWLDQRKLLPLEEWQTFLENSSQANGDPQKELLDPIQKDIEILGGLVFLRQNRVYLELLRDHSLEDPPQERQELILDLLAYQGPRSFQEMEDIYGEIPGLKAMIEELVERGDLLLDAIIAERQDKQFCTMENMEFLLRLARRERQPQWSPRPLKELPMLMAHHQGLLHPQRDGRALQSILDQFIGLPLQAELWETAVLPSRILHYLPRWLDDVLRQSEVQWIGMGEKQVGFSFPQESSLWMSPQEEVQSERNLPQGSFDYFQLKDIWKLDSRGTVEELWKGLWEGRWTNDNLGVLRKAIENKYRLPDLSKEMPRSSGGHRQLSRWQSSRPMEGLWFSIPQPEESSDDMEEMERKKDRVRQLLSRYPLLARPILQRESSLLSWGQLFPALRLMELSGELVSGFFLEDMPSLQFTKASVLKNWKELELWQQNIWFIHAQDPASLCGCGLDLELPHRKRNTWLVYRGEQLMMVLQSKGKHMDLRFEPQEDFHPREFWETLLTRETSPLKHIEVEMINGEKPQASEYRTWLQSQGFTNKGSNLVLRRTYP